MANEKLNSLMIEAFTNPPSVLAKASRALAKRERFGDSSYDDDDSDSLGGTVYFFLILLASLAIGFWDLNAENRDRSDDRLGDVGHLIEALEKTEYVAA